MDELREAVTALVREVRAVEAVVSRGEDLPSASELASLQKAVDRIQQTLNRLQTAMDVWSGATEGV